MAYLIEGQVIILLKHKDYQSVPKVISVFLNKDIMIMLLYIVRLWSAGFFFYYHIYTISNYLFILTHEHTSIPKKNWPLQNATDFIYGYEREKDVGMHLTHCDFNVYIEGLEISTF